MLRRQRQYGNVLFSALKVPTSKPGTEEGNGQRRLKVMSGYPSCFLIARYQAGGHSNIIAAPTRNHRR